MSAKTGSDTITIAVSSDLEFNVSEYGDELAVSRYETLRPIIEKGKQIPCAAEGMKFSCVAYRKKRKSDSYGSNMYFVKPVPFVYFDLKSTIDEVTRKKKEDEDADTEDADIYDLDYDNLDEVKRLPTYDTITLNDGTLQQYVNSNTKSIRGSSPSYEKVDLVEGGQRALDALQRASEISPSSDCIGGDDVYCRRIYKYKKIYGYKNKTEELALAACTVTNIDGLSSPPIDCQTIAFQRENNWYILAYVSPARDEDGYGAGAEGLTCVVPRVSGEQVANVVAATAAADPLNITIVRNKPIKQGYTISGKKAAELSKVFRPDKIYEWTVLSMRVLPGEDDVLVYGTITVTVNRQIAGNRVQFNEPSGKQVERYSKVAKEQFSKALSEATRQVIECEYD